MSQFFLSLVSVSAFLLLTLLLELLGKVDNCCTKFYHTSSINRNICLCQANVYAGQGCGFVCVETRGLHLCLLENWFMHIKTYVTFAVAQGILKIGKKNIEMQNRLLPCKREEVSYRHIRK